MSGEHSRLLEPLQDYASKKIQRFHPRVPNACSRHSLGWISLGRLVQLRKLLFIRSILVMGHDDVIRVVFIERYRAIKRQGHLDDLHAESVVSDLIYTLNLFNLNEEVDNMVERDQMYQKNVWKKLVRERAWSLEDMYWRIEYCILLYVYWRRTRRKIILEQRVYQIIVIT